MEYSVRFLSFFVVQAESQDSQSPKRYKHFQTLTHEQYESNALKLFLDGEFARITKRKVEKNPKSEQVPTKIGRFIVEPDHDLSSNPNYNLFARLRSAENTDQFLGYSDELVRAYMDTTSIRSGALIVVSAKCTKYFDEPFIFVLKCDFEPKIARITDEKSLVNHVEMAINAKNMKSIQYPFMPEEGMVEEWELKIHQSSHARYFEDFLKFVDYEKSIPEIVNHQVMDMVQQHIEHHYTESSDEREKEEREIEMWSAGEQRALQEKWSPEQVVEAAAHITQHQPDLEMKFKLDHIAVKAKLTDYGDRIHLAKTENGYAVIIEGDHFQFEKGVSPLELLKPDDLKVMLNHIIQKPARES